MRCLLSLLLLLVTAEALAESGWTPNFQKIKKELVSPVTTKAKYTFWSGAATTLILSTVYRDTLVEDTKKEFQEEKPLDSSSDYGDLMGRLVLNVGYVGGQWMAERLGGSPNGYRRAWLMTKATIYSGAVTTILKHTIRQERPNKGDRLSFPSGHSTTAFAFASVAAAEHSLGWGIGAYTLATFVALSRINDNEHYLHDVVAGATIGTSFGLGLYYLQAEAQTESTTRFMVLPQDQGWMALVRHEF